MTGMKLDVTIKGRFNSNLPKDDYQRSMFNRNLPTDKVHSFAPLTDIRDADSS
jgi:hypothetical protein